MSRDITVRLSQEYQPNCMERAKIRDLGVTVLGGRGGVICWSSLRAFDQKTQHSDSAACTLYVTSVCIVKRTAHAQRTCVRWESRSSNKHSTVHGQVSFVARTRSYLHRVAQRQRCRCAALMLVTTPRNTGRALIKALLPSD